MKYKFLNLNPLGERELDCVCRAISLGTEKDYYEVKEDLELIGQLFKCEKLCVCCYKYLLDFVYGLDRIEEYQGITVEEFLDHNQNGTYIIRVDGHLTCAIDGICYDIWDCTQEIIDLIWTL